MPSMTVTVVNDSGLHARPGRVFVKNVREHKCKVTVRKGDRVVDAHSTLAIMSIDCGPRDEIEINVEGVDADRTLADLVRVVADGLGEPAVATHQVRNLSTAVEKGRDSF